MTFLPVDTWLATLEHPVRLALLIAISAVFAAAVFLMLPAGSALKQRTLGAAAVLVSAALVLPLSVATLFWSHNDWVWGLAILTAGSLMMACFTLAYRISAGCLIFDGASRTAAVAAVASGWLLLVFSGASQWALFAAITLCAGALTAHLLKGKLGPAGIGNYIPGLLLAIPVALTGVAWSGLAVLAVGAGIILAGQYAQTPERRIAVERWGQVITYTAIGVVPLLATGFAIPHVDAVITIS